MIEDIKRDRLGRTGTLTMEKSIEFPAMLFDSDRGYAVGKGKDIDMGRFPEVRYPIHSSKLNDVQGEGPYGALYFKGDDLRVSHKGAEIYIFPHLIELIGDPTRFIDAVVNARKLIGYEPVLYVPGAGKPNHMAVFTYLGINLFDYIPLRMAALKHTYFDENGEWESDLSRDELMERNMESSLRELNIVKRAIENRRLRDLVEMRARSEPWLYALLRLSDEEHWQFFERYEPVRPKRVNYPGPEAITRPEVMRFRRRVLERWRPRGDVLLLLPCSARKPYSRSRTHRKFREVLQSVEGWGTVQELIVTSPLIVVPRELERYYPAGYYDAAVRGKWDYMEIEAIKEALENIKRMGSFRHVIIHLPEDMEFVSDAIHGEWTADGSVTSDTSLRNLKNALENAITRGESPKKRLLWTLQAMVEYQFGIDGESMVDSVKGRWPNIKGFREGKQTVMFIEDKGSLSLTSEGGRILAENGRYRVFIGDFEIRGDVFSVGVESADPEIREGDDVVVMQKDMPVAVGIAEQSSYEMMESKKGVAVRVRKKIKGL